MSFINPEYRKVIVIIKNHIKIQGKMQTKNPERKEKVNKEFKIIF